MSEHELPEWVKEGLSGLPVKRSLPKWPILQVVGQDVAPEVGREICLRTTQPYAAFSGGSDEWKRELAAAYGVALDGGGSLSWDEEQRIRETLGILELDYLGNDRVTASRFEHPTGWCGWDGAIGTDGTCLDSKWPTLEGLGGELELIAQTWPELAMTVQLSSHHSAEKPYEYWPFLRWVVEGGEVELQSQPGFPLHPVRLPVTEQVGEEAGHGVDIETLRLAVSEAKEKNG